MSSQETEKCCSPRPSGSSREKPQPKRSGRELSERRFLSRVAAFHTPMSSLRVRFLFGKTKEATLEETSRNSRYTRGTTDLLGCIQELRGQRMVSCVIACARACVCACACVEGRGGEPERHVCSRRHGKHRKKLRKTRNPHTQSTQSFSSTFP